MDRDTGALLILLGFALAAGTFVAVFAQLSRRAATVQCPQCGGRIPKTAITVDGVDCRHCDWRLQGSGTSRPSHGAQPKGGGQ